MPNPIPEPRILTPHELQTDAIVADLVRYYAIDYSESGSDTTASVRAVQEVDASPDLPPGSARLRNDPTLVAFAQLGAVHIGCQRSFISLIDSKDQYILAEATPTVSLSEPSKYNAGDNPALGAARIPMGFGVCPLSIVPFVGIDDSNANADNVSHLHPQARDIYFMDDMSQIDEYKSRPTIANWPFLKFYAGIPLRTQDGQVIGMYSVTDSRRRDGLSTFEISKMRELATVIVDHLQLVQFQDRLERSRNMIRGLGRFVDGKAVQQLWQDAFDGQLGDLPANEANADMRFATTLSTKSPMSSLMPTNTETMMTLFGDISVTSSGSKDGDTNMHSVAATGMHTESLGDVLDKVHKRDINYASYFGNEDASSSVFGSGQGITNSSDQEALVLQDEDVNFAIKTLFSRASHWIRKACDFDGILFVDASGQDIRPKIDKRGRKMANTTSHSTEFSNDHGSSKSCDLLGFSLEPRPRPSIGLPSTLQVEIPQSTLGGLLRKYPRGSVFLFDEEGHLLQTETVENETRKTRKGFTHHIEKAQVAFEKEKDQLEAYQLLDICEGARSIAFFPLWDPHRDQWYAGSLAWSLDPIRVLQHEELMFLGAFGSCVMAEKSKIDMLNADRDKQDFISSVSHELRTPLHGILASVDSLADLVSEIAQDEMRTIIVCGDILMDTMDHILDYSKMTRDNTKLVKTGGRGKAWQETTNRAGRLESFDFSKLFENVVEGTVAGFSFRNSSRVSQEKPSQVEMYRSTQVTPPNLNHNVMVVLEIDYKASWLFESQIGAWKRILTNAFGNALKYTTAGFVRVSLTLSTPPEHSDKSPEIMLQIEDSGIGMSKEFLKHGLYTPFVQANSLSVGTGLGLSIVRQLVSDLDGTINIQSEVDFGTRITIKAPLKASTLEELDLTATGTNTSIRDIPAWCKGLTICLIGFNYIPDLEEIPTGILNVRARRMLAIRSSISSCASAWFGMKVKHCATLDEAEGDIFCGIFSQLNLAEYTARTQPLIVFEDLRTGLRPDTSNGIFYLSQPFGPHKFGRILGQCLEYRSTIPDNEKESSMAGSQVLDEDSMAVDVSGGPEQSLDVAQLKDTLQSTEMSSSLKRPRPVMSRSTSYYAPHLKRHGLNQNAVLTPLRAPSPAPSLEPEPRSVVLLVEDNAINMRILVNLMKKANHQHRSAINGLEAVHAYQANPKSFKVILMDISMPIKDGIQATREIRQFEHENNLPRVRVVAVTCFSSAEVQTNAFQSGVDMFALKPMPMKALKPILDLDPNDVVPPPSADE